MLFVRLYTVVLNMLFEYRLLFTHKQDNKKQNRDYQAAH